MRYDFLDGSFSWSVVRDVRRLRAWRSPMDYVSRHGCDHISLHADGGLKMHLPFKTKFPWRLWYWTKGEESLFRLNKDELEWFKLLVTQTLIR